MHEGFKSDIGTTLTDLCQFVEADLTGQNDQGRALVFPTFDSEPTDYVSLGGNMQFQFWGVFTQIMKYPKVGNNHPVRTHLSDRFNEMG